jgi:UDP-4-amino-4-deoxy-L-arabinose formyltransferase/UDP-glucuronic acid dehydrogenase (UDP-4-keto-hexauronic acid decarboxylating)
MKILLAAEEAAGVQTLKAIQASGHELVAVLTSSEQDSSMRGATVATVAQNLGLPVLAAKRVKDPLFANEVSQMSVDILLNVHSLYIIKAPVLEAVKVGAFNLHPGPLPDYAGMNAPSWAIFNNEKQHGVTLHWMTAGIDEGTIAYQELFDLNDKDTGLSVSTKCVRLGIQMIQTLLATLHEDPARIPKLSQDFSKRRYFGLKTPFERIQWEMGADQLERFVRASDYYPLPSPWGYPKAKLGEQDIGLMKVTKTGVSTDSVAGNVKEHEGTIWLATRDEWLAVQKVQVDGKVVDAKSVLQDGKRLQ